MAVKEPVIFTEKDEMRKWSRSMRSQGKTIELVPTIGYLHQGHLSLVDEAHKHAKVVVVSIYVNPGQFSPSEDLSTYPSDFHGDILKLKSVPGGVDAVFAPKNLYDYRESKKNEIDVDMENKNSCKKGVVSCVEERGIGHETWVRVEKLEKGLCGKSRPVFFRGVATIVCKLFNIVEPDVAVFGKKDYQQWRIIQRMGRHFTVPDPLFLARMIGMLLRDLDFGIEIMGSDIVRDRDGLALSSRNVHLSPEEREKALSISRSLLKAKSDAKIGLVNCKELTDTVVQTITHARCNRVIVEY
ncbi:hypothetical protein SLEP1_g680 [Rubroshorea leprosula]|uniref:Pantoate--beta-alanine ligase n=1 Tax=Rubroshorea leprosula TaxID=152421 RepID=A0AAV5HG29_9ROSI|nr:hypothetical protein SLEP1_g680 [Rubroshorea leprosula]